MQKLYFIPLLLLFMSCSNPDLKKGFHTSYKNRTVICKKLLFDRANQYKLTQCDEGVKEIINAVNIIIYE